eukprot:TRINITY_DN68621_c0_g1_i1.p1 TRINITY_DN68621_c0_g1~~TRINITY_DN68621_c0_g1_i1.p1  ORF type:complete len:361 (-),score=67.97 TRINITY_DN68621_c0_g1_i1:65-1147(-)
MSKRSRDADESSAKATGKAVSSNAAAAAYVDTLQNTMRLTKEGPVNPDTIDHCGAFASVDMDNSWDLGVFKKRFSIDITSMNDDMVTFDMIGIDPPLANAFRRILIAEVPTIAISTATIHQNTSVIHDENLAHRLGLVPIVMEPELLEWKPADSDFTEDNSVQFSLHKACAGERMTVYSGDMKWIPLSDNQRERFKDNPPRPVADDIIIAKMRAGQEMEIVCHCEKGIGRDHAKWSPVCTATYRLLPHITFKKDIKDKDAEELKNVCPMGVFDIEDIGGGSKRATVAHPRKCTTCRECITSFEGEAKGLVLGKRKDFYLFSIESVGQVSAMVLFERALTKLKQKCAVAKDVLCQRQGQAS